MFRYLKTAFSCMNEFSLNSLPFTHVSVRYRKPFWLGTAPSKKFRVPKRHPQDPVEYVEMSRVVKNYKTYYKGIIAYHQDLNAKRSVTDPGVIDEQSRQEQEDWEKSNAINNEWNALRAAEREQRLAIEKEERILKVIAEKEEIERIEKEKIEQAELLVQMEIEKSKSYITRENIDEHIEKALCSEIDYNYAIDKKGNIYQGKRTSPVQAKAAVEEIKEEASSQS